MEMREPVYPGAALAAGKKTPPDAIEILMQDHREVLAALGAFVLSADGREKAVLLRQIAAGLLAHMTIEEELLYPAAQGLTGDEDLVGEAYDDHAEARELLERMLDPACSSEECDAAAAELRQALAEHIETEESQLFPNLRAAGLDGYGLGRAMAVRKVEALADAIGKPLPLRAHVEGNAHG